MMDNTTMTKGKIIAVMAIWFFIFGIFILSWKYWYSPMREQIAGEQAEIEHQATIEQTSADSLFKHEVNFHLDSFSGYAILRSAEFHSECAAHGIKIKLTDDKADYASRLKALSDGRCQMAAFTLDALIKASAHLGDLPATVVLVIDETKGADAMVAPKVAFPNIDALNSSDVKIVCTPDSPSETLARVVMVYFEMDSLAKNPFEFVNGASEVYDLYRKSGPTDKKAFVLWEPYVSKVLEHPDYHCLVDSEKFRGYIVDVVVVNRDFLLKNREIVKSVAKSYLTAVFKHRNDMATLLADDSARLGEALKSDQVDRLVTGIWWKNTQENFAHFGQTTGHGLQHLEEMCGNITEVLVKTKGISQDPTGGKHNLWYYDGIVKDLQASNWHPGAGEGVRREKSLLALSESEWISLRPVGTLQVPRLVFARGTSRLSEMSHATLDDLVQKLTTWPRYYLIVRGNASQDGDLEANLKLTTDRAQAAMDYLLKKGVDKNRIRTETSKPNGSTTVAFVLGELPY